MCDHCISTYLIIYDLELFFNSENLVNCIPQINVKNGQG